MNIPLKIIWYLTSACSEKCQGCPFADSTAQPDELSAEEASKFLKECISLGIFSISYTGGEPTLRSDLFDLLAQGQKFNLLQFLATNGHALDFNYTKQLSRLGVKGVAVSIDSYLPKKNDVLRGAKSFSKTVSAIENCHRHNIPVSLSATVDDNNLEDLEGLINLAAELKVSDLRLQAKTVFFKNSAEKKLSGRGMQELLKILKAKNSTTKINFGCSIGFLRFAEKKEMNSVSELGLCDIGKDTLTLRSDGVLTTCVQLLPGSETLGNVKATPLHDILDTAKEPIEHWLEKGNEEKYKDTSCGTCSFLKECKAGCRGFARFKNGDFFDSDPDCLIRTYNMDRRT